MKATQAKYASLERFRQDLKPECTVVSYAPIIDAKPSDMTTVFTTMKK
jgi:hypothetical protein